MSNAFMNIKKYKLKKTSRFIFSKALMTDAGINIYRRIKWPEMLTTKSVWGMPELFSTASVAMLAGNVQISREARNQDGDARGEYE